MSYPYPQQQYGFVQQPHVQQPQQNQPGSGPSLQYPATSSTTAPQPSPYGLSAMPMQPTSFVPTAAPSMSPPTTLVQPPTLGAYNQPPPPSFQPLQYGGNVAPPSSGAGLPPPPLPGEVRKAPQPTSLPPPPMAGGATMPPPVSGQTTTYAQQASAPPTTFAPPPTTTTGQSPQLPPPPTTAGGMMTTSPPQQPAFHYEYGYGGDHAHQPVAGPPSDDFEGNVAHPPQQHQVSPPQPGSISHGYPQPTTHPSMYPSAAPGQPFNYPQQPGGIPQQQPTYPQQQQQPHSGGDDVADQMAKLSLANQQSYFASSANVQNYSDSLPRPSYMSLTKDVPQPDVTPIFERRNVGSRVDFSTAQSSSRFIRATVQCIPNSPSIQSKWALPFGAIIHPFAEPPAGESVPVVNLGSAGVVRCYKCRTYVNPFVTFLDGGRKWQCNLCKKVNDVESAYFSPLDEYGQRKDIARRPELRHGTVDFLATQEYSARVPQPPAYFFVIDVSYQAVASGMVQVAAKTIRSMIDKLPGDGRTRIGFITYDSTIHFYNLKPTLSQPQMFVVGELQESLLPVPTDLLVLLDESRSVVDNLLEKLSTTMFTRNTNVESCLGAALNSAGRILGRLGGKLMVFASTIPTAGPNTLQTRELPNMLGTDAENKLLVPASNSYKDLALLYSRDQICVELFVCADQYIDLATLGSLPKYTGGQTYYYPGFKADQDAEKLRQDIIRVLSRETALESVMRIRISNGLRISNFYGHLFIRSHDLLALPNVDADKAFGIEVEHAGSFISTPNAAIQAAVLYTATNGERRIRVHNITLPITSTLDDMYKYADVNATLCLTAKRIADELPRIGLTSARNKIRDYVVQTLKVYRDNVTKSRPTGQAQIVLPDSLRLLPLYANSLIRNEALVGGNEIRSDERIAATQRFTTASVAKAILFIHPACYAIHELIAEVTTEGVPMPTRVVPLARHFLIDQGVYLLDDGNELYLWIGKQVASETDTLNDLLSVVQKLNTDITEILDEAQDPFAKVPSTDLGRAVEATVRLLRGREQAGLTLVVRLATGEYLKKFLNRKLVEDKVTASLSYEEFLRHVHNCM